MEDNGKQASVGTQMAPINGRVAPKAFTDRAIRSLRVSTGRKEFHDPSFCHGGAFGIRVSSSGKKTFFLMYRYKGKRRRLVLGDYPVMSLADARDRALRTLAQLSGGEDPADDKHRYAHAARFSQLAEQYLTVRSIEGPNQKKISDSALRDYRAMLKRDILPAFGSRKIEDVTPEDVLALMDDIAIARNAPVLANRTFELIRQIYNWGISRRIALSNPCIGLKKPGKERKGERVFSTEELKRFWEATAEEDPGQRAILRILLLTGARPKEVKRMEWSHIDEAKWTIPSDNSKNGRKHRLHLTKSALQEIDACRSAQSTTYVFPGPRDGAAITDLKRAVERVRRRMGSERSWSLRDIRRTVQTGMSEIGVQPHIVDRVLNHNVAGVRAHYDHYSYYPETRAALIKWSRWINTIVEGSSTSMTTKLMERC